MSTDTDRIRMLNDHLRKNLTGGGALITPGIAAMGAEAVERLVKTIIRQSHLSPRQYLPRKPLMLRSIPSIHNDSPNSLACHPQRQPRTFVA